MPLISALVFCLLLLPFESSSAQPALMQGAFKQLQQLIPAEQANTGPLDTDISLEQLRQEAVQLETRIRELKSQLPQPILASTADISQLTPAQVAERQSVLQDALHSWWQKQELSEQASVRLSRERLVLQKQLDDQNESTDGDTSEKRILLQQKLHNLSLKIRFTERFLVFCKQQIDLIEVEVRQFNPEPLPPQKSSPQPSPDVDAKDLSRLSVHHRSALRERLSQTRKDLIQLHNLHYEVKYQLDQVHSMELLYRLMLKQKQRLTSIPAALNTETLQQELKFKRYALLEEQALETDTAHQQKIGDALDEIEQLIYLGRELNQLEKELRARQQQLLLLLEQKQIWMITAPALGPAGIQSMARNLTEQIPVIVRLMWQKIVSNGWLLFVLIPALLISRWLGKATRCGLSRVNRPADITGSEWLRLITGLTGRTTPVFIMLLLIMHMGHLFEKQNAALVYGLLLLSFCWVLLLDATQKNGFIDKCLDYDGVDYLHHRQLATPSMIALWIVGLSLQWYENPFDNRLGQLLLLVCSGSQLGILWHAGRQRHNKRHHRYSKGNHRHKESVTAELNWRKQCIRLGCMFTLSLVFISSALGYIQLSWLFFSHLQVVLLAGSFLWIMYLFSVQALEIRTANLVIQQAIKLRKEARQPLSSRDALQQSRNNMHEMVLQGRAILSLLFILITVLLFMLIWHNISPLLSPLSEARLFSFTGEKTALTIALGAFTGFVLTIVVTFVTAHNLPGLLQIMLSEKMMRQPGTVYIINRMLVYLIWATGCTVALGQIGLPWEKLQWVILAISVGVGLGLQEIVANFFSGLIILIERPIRVGDTITINEIEGIVRQITVRATIIEIVDRKEFIVPNKAIITGQLTNWSLSSNLLRIQLWYGVSHSTDNDLVIMLLLRAAEESPMVLKKPPSEAAFIECTEHCDRYELRIFIDVDDRFQVKNQVNQRVRQLFDEHSVQIAHLKHDIQMQVLQNQKKQNYKLDK
ncbi:mechanosensitive ion channel domain-containing protein [Endozoicomonadaceae bacterium StTr2]